MAASSAIAINNDNGVAEQRHRAYSVNPRRVHLKAHAGRLRSPDKFPANMRQSHLIRIRDALQKHDAAFYR